MILRALFLLALVVGLSVGLTFWLGNEVLLALGLILTQLKVLGKKLISIELGSVLTWLKLETRSFFQVEILKKWFYSTLVPLMVGSAVLRKIKSFIGTYIDGVKARYDAMMTWYRNLPPLEKAIATLVVLFATLALTISSLGLWLVLFTVQLPIWVLAALSASGKMIVLSLRKWLFKVVAFFQLTWILRALERRLPPDVLKRKRKLNFRMARKVVRQRRLTVKQLSSGKDGMALRWALLRARWKSEEDQA